jgi:hypothetical protein
MPVHSADADIHFLLHHPIMQAAELSESRTVVIAYAARYIPRVAYARTVTLLIKVGRDMVVYMTG